jgi:hypothetical protein
MKRENKSKPVISTVPMLVTAKWLADQPVLDIPEFKSAEIKVQRFRVKDANVFQTIYYPYEGYDVYRASMTKDMLIVESMTKINLTPKAELKFVLDSFGLNQEDVEPIESTSQRFGKIAPIDDEWRKNFIFNLTNQHNIYSVGRFATWRNILLDDVLNDLFVVKKLMNSGVYERSKFNSK